MPQLVSGEPGAEPTADVRVDAPFPSGPNGDRQLHQSLCRGAQARPPRADRAAGGAIKLRRLSAAPLTARPGRPIPYRKSRIGAR